jgi:nucleoside phosphorylase
MIYIITALKAEAAHFIAYYQLDHCQDAHFSLYENENIKLIIAGIGKIHAACATTYLLQKFPSKNPKIFNIGTCASTHKDIMIGSLYQIRKIIDLATNHIYHIANNGEAITCVDVALSSSRGLKTALVDMESVAVYLAAKHFGKDITILKIVSDHTDNNIPKASAIQALFQAQSRPLKEYLDV